MKQVHCWTMVGALTPQDHTKYLAKEMRQFWGATRCPMKAISSYQQANAKQLLPNKRNMLAPQGQITLLNNFAISIVRLPATLAGSTPFAAVGLLPSQPPAVVHLGRWTTKGVSPGREGLNLLRRIEFQESVPHDRVPWRQH